MEKLEWHLSTDRLLQKIRSLGFEILASEPVIGDKLRINLAGGIKLTWYKSTGTLLCQGKNPDIFRKAWIES